MDAEKIEQIRKRVSAGGAFVGRDGFPILLQSEKDRRDLLAELDRVGGELEQQKIINESLEKWKTAVEKEHDDTHAELARVTVELKEAHEAMVILTREHNEANTMARRMAEWFATHKSACPCDEQECLVITKEKCADEIIRHFSREA